MGRRLSSRFVAGMHTDDALRAAAALNDQGISVTLDSLGKTFTLPKKLVGRPRFITNCWMRFTSGIWTRK